MAFLSSRQDKLWIPSQIRKKTPGMKCFLGRRTPNPNRFIEEMLYISSKNFRCRWIEFALEHLIRSGCYTIVAEYSYRTMFFEMAAEVCEISALHLHINIASYNSIFFESVSG